MAKIGNYPATNKQIEIFNDSLASHSLFEDLVWKALNALDAMVDLPQENEDGEKVVHGANKRMYFIAQEYYSAAQGLKLLYPRESNMGDDYFPFMYLRCRMNGLVHGWIAGLVEENGGIPPRTWTNEDLQRHSKFAKAE
jgi:hypothetical protein